MFRSRLALLALLLSPFATISPAEALGMVTLAEDLGRKVDIKLDIDALAANGHG